MINCHHICLDCKREFFHTRESGKTCPFVAGFWVLRCNPCENKAQKAWLAWLDTKPEGRIYNPPEVSRKGTFEP